MNAVVDTEQARVLMIEQQIRPWDVLDTEVLQTLRQVPREHYVPRQRKGWHLWIANCP
jgi:protein-L-isoaspartate O-methyltransferase